MNEQNSIANTVASLFRGRWISPFTKSSVLSKKKHNEVLARLNPLLNISAYLGDTAGQVNYSENNVIIKLPKVATGGTSTGNMNYRGTYDSTQAYAVGDVVRVKTDAGGASAGVWVCVVAQPNNGAKPIWPEPADSGGGTTNWEMLAFGVNWYHYSDPTNSCAAMKVQVNAGDAVPDV